MKEGKRGKKGKKGKKEGKRREKEEEEKRVFLYLFSGTWDFFHIRSNKLLGKKDTKGRE